MWESRSSGSGSVSVDVERISFGGKVRTSNNLPPASLLSFLPSVLGVPFLFLINSWPLRFYAEALCFPPLAIYLAGLFSHGLWRNLFMDVFCLLLSGEKNPSIHHPVPSLFFLCCCFVLLVLRNVDCLGFRFVPSSNVFT
jgi:hypothetical protein